MTTSTRGNAPEGRKGVRCRRVGPGSSYSSVQIEFEDGAQLIVNRNTVKLTRTVTQK